MVQKGVLFTVEAKSGKDELVEQFLRTAGGMSHQEPATTAWFAIRFGRGEYGIFALFLDAAAREAHLTGPIIKALREMTPALFIRPHTLRTCDVLAAKLDLLPPAEPVTKGLLLSFKAKEGHENEVRQFLRDAQPYVMGEPKTTAWFALHFDDGAHGIFDVFPDAGGRFSHLTGHIPRELAKHALTLLGSVPDLDMLSIVAQKFAG